MVNTIVITENINLVKKLLIELEKLSLNLNISKVLTSKSEMDKLINCSNIDMVIVDKSIEKECSIEFIKQFQDVIVIVSYSKSCKLLNQNVLNNINFILHDGDLERKRVNIMRELEYIGYRFKYKGSHYLLDTILQLYSKQNSMVDDLQSVIYPIIAKKYDKSVYNVKSSINKATEHMYYESDSTRLQEYFNFPDDIRPTVKQVVFTVINKLA